MQMNSTVALNGSLELTVPVQGYTYTLGKKYLSHGNIIFFKQKYLILLAESYLFSYTVNSF